MALHLKFIYQQTNKPYEQLVDAVNLMRSVAKNNDLLPVPRVDKISEEMIILRGMRQEVRRIYCIASDSGEYKRLGWVLTTDIHYCMLCGISFKGYLYDSTKLHCHACGIVACHVCCSSLVAVRELASTAGVRVCRACYYGQVIGFQIAADVAPTNCTCLPASSLYIYDSR